jgi:predicted ATP-binding protein involved in virulence
VRRPQGGVDEHPLLAKPTFMIDKAGGALAFDQLSEGERVFIAMIADIARRLAIANTDGDPLEGRGIVMIDEIELHLHPKWQAQILDRLLGVFPNLQFIVTTHSPLVLTDVERGQVRVLEGFEVYQPAHPVQGRDAGSILAEVFQTNPLPTETQDAVSQISSLIDADKFDEARAKLDELESKLGGLDVEVTRLRTAIDLLAS